MKYLATITSLLLSPLLAQANIGSAIGKLDYTPATPIEGTTYYASGVLIDKESLNEDTHTCNLNDLYFVTSARLFKKLPLNTSNLKIQIPWTYDTTAMGKDSKFGSDIQDIKVARGFIKLKASLMKKNYYSNLAVLKVEYDKNLEGLKDSLKCIGFKNSSNNIGLNAQTIGYGYYDLAPTIFSSTEMDIGLDGSVLSDKSGKSFYGMRVNDYENKRLQGPDKQISSADIAEYLKGVFSGKNQNIKNGIEFLPDTDSFRFNIQQTGYSRNNFNYEFFELSEGEFARSFGSQNVIKTGKGFPFKASKIATSRLELKNYKGPNTRGILYVIEGKRLESQKDLLQYTQSRNRPRKDFSSLVIAVVENGKVVDLDLFGAKDSIANPIGRARSGFNQTLAKYSPEFKNYPAWVMDSMMDIKQSIDNIFLAYLKNISKSESQQLTAVGQVVNREMQNIVRSTQAFYNEDAVTSQTLFLNVLSSLSQIDNHLRAISDRTGAKYIAFSQLIQDFRTHQSKMNSQGVK